MASSMDEWSRVSDIGLSFRAMGIGWRMCMSARDDEAVLGTPAQANALAVGQALAGTARLQVLGIDGDVLAGAGLDQVLGADPDVAGVKDRAVEGVDTRLAAARG